MATINQTTLAVVLHHAMRRLAEEKPNDQIGASADLLCQVVTQVIENMNNHQLIAVTARIAVQRAIAEMDCPPWHP